VIFSGALLGCSAEEVLAVYEPPAQVEVAATETGSPSENESDITHIQPSEWSYTELEQRAFYLLGFDVTPVFWWITPGDRNAHLDVDLETQIFIELDDAYFSPVGRFRSIFEMQAATELLVTRRFAEDALYFRLDSTPRMFVEIDERLYINTTPAPGSWHMRLTDTILIQRGSGYAIIEAVYDAQSDEIERFHIRLVLEDDIWKLDSFPWLESNLPIVTYDPYKPPGEPGAEFEPPDGLPDDVPLVDGEEVIEPFTDEELEAFLAYMLENPPPAQEMPRA